VPQDERKFREVLDHRDDGAAELRRQDHRLDVARVLEAVADDDAVSRALGHRHDRKQLGLGPYLKAEAMACAVAVDLFHHQALLVDLDGIHRGIPVAVVILGDGLRKHVVQALQAVREDIGEAHHHRRAQVARGESLHHLEQVDLATRRGIGPHHDMPGGVDREIPAAPCGHLVEIQRVVDAPAVGRRRGVALLLDRGHAPSSVTTGRAGSVIHSLKLPA
jgi:hypothetical protein